MQSSYDRILSIYYDRQGHDDCSKYLLLYMLQQTRITLLFFLCSHFGLTYSHKPQGLHHTETRASITNVYCIKKKKKKRKGEGRVCVFFFVTIIVFFYMNRSILIDYRGMVADEKTNFSLGCLFLFFFVSLSRDYARAIQRKYRMMSTECLSTQFYHDYALCTMPILSKYSN